MKRIGSKILDAKINAYDQLYECTINEYYSIVKDILTNNQYQRGRVKSSTSVYGLLKDDLKIGCVIPPIVMAYTGTGDIDLSNIKEDDVKKLIILDGLQRSYTIKDIVEESGGNTEVFDKQYIRIELYSNISRMGILYRMLTLNTGQTRMSTRHQIDIIYSDYLDNCPVDGIEFIKEVDSKTPKKLGQYKFRDVIEGFTSYLERDCLTLDRQDLLDQIKTLTSLSTQNQNIELFAEFIDTYHLFVKTMNEQYPNEITASSGIPFGNNVIDIFNKSQPLTGFGSAIGAMQDKDIIENFEQIRAIVPHIERADSEEGWRILVDNLEKIRQNAKKIGNDQRLYFHYFFRKLFDSKRDSYLNFRDSVIEGYKEYQRDIY